MKKRITVDVPVNITKDEVVRELSVENKKLKSNVYRLEGELRRLEQEQVEMVPFEELLEKFCEWHNAHCRKCV